MVCALVLIWTVFETTSTIAAGSDPDSRICREAPHVQVRINASFLLPQDNPITFELFTHPRNEDIYVSESAYQDSIEGTQLFEMALRRRMYRDLRGLNPPARRPTSFRKTRTTTTTSLVEITPLYVDVGANIGIVGYFGDVRG